MRSPDCELGFFNCWGDPQHNMFNPNPTVIPVYTGNGGGGGGGSNANVNTNNNVTVLTTSQIASLVKDQIMPNNTLSTLPTGNNNLIKLGLVVVGTVLVIAIIKK